MPKITIKDREFEVDQFNLNDIIAVEEKIGDIRQMGKKELISENLKDIRYLLWWAIQKKTPEITEEEVGEILAVADINKIVDQVFTVLKIAGNPTVVKKQQKK